MFVSIFQKGFIQWRSHSTSSNDWIHEPKERCAAANSRKSGFKRLNFDEANQQTPFIIGVNLLKKTIKIESVYKEQDIFIDDLIIEIHNCDNILDFLTVLELT